MRRRTLLSLVLALAATAAVADGIAPSRTDLFPVWSPDGFHIAFKRERAIWVANSDELAAKKKLCDAPEGYDVSAPSWSPDGSSVLFAKLAPGDGRVRPFDVIAVDAQTAADKTIARSVGETALVVTGAAAQWLDNGRAIVFMKATEGGGELHRYDVESGATRRIAAIQGLSAFAACARSEKVAAGATLAADKGAIVLVDAAGDGTPVVLWDAPPAWRPSSGARSLMWSVGGQALVAAVVDSTEGGADRRLQTGLRLFDLNGGAKKTLLARTPLVEFLWRKDDQALWVLTRELRSSQTPRGGRVLTELPLAGAGRTVADGDIVNVARGLAPGNSVACVFRDEQRLALRSELAAANGTHTQYKLVVLFGGTLPAEITRSAILPAWSPRGNKIAFRTATTTLGETPVDAIGIAFVSSSRVEYLTFSLPEELWRADQFYLHHNHGYALQTYERLRSRVRSEDKTALEVRIWLARLAKDRLAADPGDRFKQGLETRLITKPSECVEATEAFAALGEYERGLEFFTPLASPDVHKRSALQAQLAVFDLTWRLGRFDEAEKLFLKEEGILPKYRELLEEGKMRSAPPPYDGGVLRAFRKLVIVFPERLDTRYAGADPIGLISQILSAYPNLPAADRRSALELAALIYTLRGDKGNALQEWIKVLEYADTPEDRDAVWSRICDLELEVEVQ